MNLHQHDIESDSLINLQSNETEQPLSSTVAIPIADSIESPPLSPEEYFDPTTFQSPATTIDRPTTSLTPQLESQLHVNDATDPAPFHQVHGTKTTGLDEPLILHNSSLELPCVLKNGETLNL